MGEPKRMTKAQKRQMILRFTEEFGPGISWAGKHASPAKELLAEGLLAGSHLNARITPAGRAALAAAGARP